MKQQTVHHQWNVYRCRHGIEMMYSTCARVYTYKDKTGFVHHRQHQLLLKHTQPSYNLHHTQSMGNFTFCLKLSGLKSSRFKYLLKPKSDSAERKPSPKVCSEYLLRPSLTQMIWLKSKVHTLV